MSAEQWFAGSTVGLGLIAISHAILTWPTDAVLVFVGVAVAMAFLGEVIVISRGWLVHHIGPRVIGVPVYVLFGWTAVLYVAMRVSLLIVEGMLVVLLTATLATGYDILVDHHGVESGYWTYTDDIPGPRYRSVPWWNYAGWFLISFVTARATLLVL